MQIIPVIDLKGGEAVFAPRGDRSACKPVRSPLCSTSEPLSVLRAYLALHPFKRIFLGDLDALEGEGDNEAVVAAIEAEHPEIEIWMGNGQSTLDGSRTWIAEHQRRLVLGSEAQRDAGTIAALARGKEKAAVTLSLDYHGERFLGPPALQSVTALWPETIILTTLAKVGSDAGPDLDRFAEVMRKAGRGRRVFAAGGVRHAEDLRRLAAAGASGALMASALHRGRFSRDELAAFAED